jgi:hypothetical protein
MWEDVAGLFLATVLTFGIVTALYSILLRVPFKGYAWEG